METHNYEVNFQPTVYITIMHPWHCNGHDITTSYTLLLSGHHSDALMDNFINCFLTMSQV